MTLICAVKCLVGRMTPPYNMPPLLNRGMLLVVGSPNLSQLPTPKPCSQNLILIPNNFLGNTAVYINKLTMQVQRNTSSEIVEHINSMDVSGG